MKTNFYLTVGSNGAVKATKNPRYTEWDEVCIGVALSLPDNLFSRPQINATITIKNEDVSPFAIDADTTDLVKNAIQQSTGLEVKLTITNPDEYPPVKG
jgi:hypothetical protein